MRYAEYREKKFFVGSGVVEAGCRTVIGERLKQSGMRWSVRGANAIIALRCCILSGRFEDFWASRTPWPPLFSRTPSPVHLQLVGSPLLCLSARVRCSERLLQARSGVFSGAAFQPERLTEVRA